MFKILWKCLDFNIDPVINLYINILGSKGRRNKFCHIVNFQCRLYFFFKLVALKKILLHGYVIDRFSSFKDLFEAYLTVMHTGN